MCIKLRRYTVTARKHHSNPHKIRIKTIRDPPGRFRLKWPISIRFDKINQVRRRYYNAQCVRNTQVQPLFHRLSKIQ